MTKRIFRSFLIVGMAVLLVSLTLIMGFLYSYFTGEQLKQLQDQTTLVAQGVANEGLTYFDELGISDSRITWIASDGSVLYDNESDASAMENHLERAEVREALTNGTGVSTRYSTTMTTRMDYVAKRLPDGSVVRLSREQHSVFTLLFSMIQPVLVCIAIAFAVSLFLSYRLTRRVVLPLNKVDLDDPMSNKDLEELQPLFERLDKGQKELRSSTEELRRRKNEFETATDGMQEGLVLLDDRGSILSINASASRLLGISKYCVGRDILLMNNSWEMQELLRRCLEGQYAEMIIPVEGISYRINASPVISDSNVTGAALLIRDITEREKAEQQRREFTANVSHELKTPIQTIIGCAELMKSGMVREEDQTAFAEKIYNQSTRMADLIEDIIRLSKLDEGGVDLKPEEVDLTSVAQTEIAAMASAAEKAQVTVLCTNAPVVLNCVKSLAVSIIHNLIDNAIKYNRTGGSVNVEIRESGPRILLAVRDTGIGIPEDSRERIFERFYRVDKSRSREAGGTGLGLSIVKHAVHLMNARIDVNSTVGKGSEFIVTIPKQ